MQACSTPGVNDVAKVLLLAASGLAREVISSIEQTGDHEVVGLLDDDLSLHGGVIGGARVLGGIGLAAESGAYLLICVGSGRSRAALAIRLERLGVSRDRYATHIHESVLVGERSVIGEGSIVLAGSVLTCDVRLGCHVVLMPHVTLTHDDFVADFATLAAGVTVGGGVKIGRGAYLGMNAAVRQDLGIGEHAVLGMGSVLLRNLPAEETWVGNPARDINMFLRQPAPAAVQGRRTS